MWRRSAGGQVGVYCRGASILLVGTHKDRVPDPRDHERISYLLIDRFQAPPPPLPRQMRETLRPNAVSGAL